MLPSYNFKLDTSGNIPVPPDDWVSGSTLVAREEGGIAISDPSQGYQGYVWESSYVPSTGSIRLTNLTTSSTSVVLSGIMNVIAISFSFDQNMRPMIVWTTSQNTASYYWYDTVTQGFLITSLPEGTDSVALTMDDKRQTLVRSNLSDILLFYTNNNELFVRVQRERFNTDHKIADLTPKTKLGRVGMGSDLRLKIELLGGTLAPQEP